MKKIVTILLIGLTAGIMIPLSESCSTTQGLSQMDGSELWSNNCSRCHNAPSGAVYSSEQWDILTTHMRMRAQITAVETEKIVEFLKSAK